MRDSNPQDPERSGDFKSPGLPFATTLHQEFYTFLHAMAGLTFSVLSPRTPHAFVSGGRSILPESQRFESRGGGAFMNTTFKPGLEAAP